MTKYIQSSVASGLALAAALTVAFCLAANSAMAAPEGGIVGGGTPGSCTQAVLFAKAAGGGTVSFACGPNPYTITLTSFLNITTSTKFDGGGLITLSGGHTNGVFLVNAGKMLTLTNITVADGRQMLGGCVSAFGSVTMVQTTLRDCHALTGGLLPASGGALAIIGGNLSLSNTQILNNVADRNGGGLYINGGAHSLDHVTISGNKAEITYTNSGGGIYAENHALLTIQNSHIDNNLFGYTGLGGGIAMLSGTVQLANVTLNDNHGENAGLGGGLYLLNAIANLNTVTATGNSNVYAGAGIDSEASDLSIAYSTLSGNTASSNGGGINSYLGSLHLSHVSVNGNVVDSDGGGIDLYSTPTSIDNSIINNNSGGRDGGAINNYRSTLTIADSTLSGNINDGGGVGGGQGDGGAIYNDSSLLLVNNSTFSNNQSSGRAGAVFNASGSTASMTNTTLSANSAITGGGFYNEDVFSTNYTIITLTNVTLKDNGAAAGGAFYNGNTAYNLVYLKNTVIADSVGTSNCRGKAFTFSKYSLTTDHSCALAGVGNLPEQPAQLDPLADYGGPTKTHLPRAPSPLVNGVGGADCPLTDQRGVLRPQGGLCDLGAVERQAIDPLLVPMLYIPIVRR